jgi:hypothetical protein
MLSRWTPALALCALGALSFGAAPVTPPPAPPEPPESETARLETIEDLSESLANEVLDLSVAVRDRDLTRIGTYFAETVEAPPVTSAPRAPPPQVKWI